MRLRRITVEKIGKMGGDNIKTDKKKGGEREERDGDREWKDEAYRL